MIKVEESPARKKFSNVAKRVMMFKQVHAAVTTVVDGEESQEIWPATAAWFLGPKAENLQLLKSLVNKAIDEHAEFRKYKYFPLDPEYVTKKLEKEPAFQEATEDLRDNLDVLCERLKNSVPFSNFRSQVSQSYLLCSVFMFYFAGPYVMGHYHSLQCWVHSSLAVQPEQRGQHGQWGDPPAGEGGCQGSLRDGWVQHR